ncbi:MAG: hypothetical protein K2W33_17650, partial [Burkholderiales bacterium]|nr:hypothetical protein [Burkholderiales bacterium]
MTPVDPLSPPPRPAHAMRGGRLAAVVLAVLVTHGLLLTHWLQHSAATPDLAAATSPTARQPDRSTASVHLTPPTANPSVAQPNVSVAAQATNPDAPATRLPSHTRPQGIPLPATAT